ncbi:hypothetical protein [Listeria cossartiae]|uniref:hypothetical protein n=1 Tax=Listeria cossartiae TaxID=2838249 RepID=UPI001628B7C7|nr:hypothetical protein [Listeria cossartiae]MBC1544888.1 hypothetical protein [Listeria cossartiae subsp. cossartiae]MBC1550519.1 hypothetical protein [Listeria cossartiae subsp. cossartiae]MBC1569437.1 hypothetical protein [Listeria cossartiae subsp. cossartiae]
MLRYIALFILFALVILITMRLPALLAKWKPNILSSFWFRTLTFIIIGYVLVLPALYIGRLLLK